MACASRVGFLLLLLIWGCYQRFLPIRTIETKDGIAFEFPEVAEGLSSKRRYELLDLMVSSKGCGSYCTHWDIVSAPGPRNAYMSGARITYGDAVPGTVIRTPPRALMPGVYTVGATVQEYGSDDMLVRSLSTMSDFEVYQDASGKLRARSKEAAKKGGCQ